MHESAQNDSELEREIPVFEILDVAGDAVFDVGTVSGFAAKSSNLRQAGDPGQWAKIFWSRRAHPGGDVNLHARVAGSANERLALLFRDWFRAHPEAIPAYASFKRSLAAVTPDPDAYSDVKDPVVDLVITVAETWAASAGWQP